MPSTSARVTVSAVVAALDRRYDPATAAAWDAVGLVCGDPDAPVARVHFAVDPVEAAAHEAIDSGAEVLVTHHPLYLRGTSTVAATSGKGRLVHRMIRAGVALYTAHTNADVAMPGVSDALANAVGVDEVEPLQVAEPETWDKLTVYVPQAHAQRLVDALSAAGAGRLGDYDRCAYLVDGTGTFRPGPGATPAIGRVGQVVTVTETRIEMVAPRRLRPAVTSALLAQHPYEEPAWDVVELAPRSGRTGLGRVGRLRQPCRLAELVRRVAATLPSTATGVRAAGWPDREVSRLAVCGGSGGDLVEAAAAAGADALLTADLRHHPASDAINDTGLALLDAAHWATEWPWLEQAATLLRQDLLEAHGTTVETFVSALVTDPWTLRADAPTTDEEP